MPTEVKLDVPISVATEPEIDLLIDFGEIGGEGVFEGSWLDPVTRTLMLVPQQFALGHTPTPEALTFTTPASWETVSVGSEANQHALSKNGSTEKVETAASMPANQPLVFNLFIYGQTGANGVWEAAKLYFGQYTLVLLSNGYSYIDATGLARQGGYVSAGYGAGNSGQASLSNRWVRLLVQPMNRRHILIYSDAGGAWVYKRDDLDLANSGNTIIAAGKAGFAFPSSKAFCQIQRATYPASGTYTTPVTKLPYKPKASSVVGVTTHADAGTGSASAVVVTSSGGAYTPDGATDQVRVKFTLTGNAQVYAAQVNWSGAREERVGASASVTARGLTLGFDSEPQADAAGFTLDAMEVANTGGWPDGLREGASVGVYDGDNELYLGLAGGASLAGAQAPASDVMLSGMWRMLEQTQFLCDWRADGLTDSEVITKCLRCAGVADARMDIAAGVALPADPRGKVTCWPVRAGTTAAALVREILAVWTNRKLVVARDGTTLKVTYKDAASGAPVKTFYRSHLSAGWENCYWSNLKLAKKRRSGDGIAWTGVVVRGRDPDGAYIYASSQMDTDSQNPAIAEGARPETWFGGKVIKTVCDDRLRTQAAVDHVRDVMQARHTQSVTEGTWTAEHDKSLAPGSVVTLEGHGNFRIVSATPTGDVLERGSREYRPAQYVGEMVS